MSSPKPWVKYEEIGSNEGVFEMSPLVRGMGVTIGNSLRRVLLSSLDGYAVVAISIDGVPHEFTSVPSVVQDVLDIIANLKRVVFSGGTEEEYNLKLVAKKKGDVTASSIELVDDLVIHTPDQFLFELTENVDFSADFTIRKGVGYQPADLNVEGNALNLIKIDSSYSPVLNVNHEVDSIRVGKELGYDLLRLNVLTDGSISPEDAVRNASDILLNMFGLFANINEEPEQSVEDQVEDGLSSDQNDGLSLTVDELELSARSSNCLKRAGITQVSDLVQRDFTELLQIKNFGKKSADEINSRLQQFGLALKGIE